MGENSSEMRKYLDLLHEGRTETPRESEHLGLIRQLHEGLQSPVTPVPTAVQAPVPRFNLPMSAGLLISRHFDLARFIIEHTDHLTESRHVDGEAVVLIGRRIAEGFDLSDYVRPRARAGTVLGKVREILEATNAGLPKSVLVESLPGHDGHWLADATEDMRRRCQDDGAACIEVINELAREYAETEGGNHEAFEMARDALEKRAWEMGLKDGCAASAADTAKEDGSVEVVLPIRTESRKRNRRLAETLSPQDLQAAYRVLCGPYGKQYALVGAKAAGNTVFAKEMHHFLNPNLDFEEYVDHAAGRFDPTPQKRRPEELVAAAQRHREAAVRAILASARQAQAETNAGQGQQGQAQASVQQNQSGRPGQSAQQPSSGQPSGQDDTAGTAAHKAKVDREMAPVANKDDGNRDQNPDQNQARTAGTKPQASQKPQDQANKASSGDDGEGGKTRSAFGAAFRAARKKGLMKFEFQGKQYHTRMKTENDQQWKAAMRKARGEAAPAEQPAQTAPQQTEQPPQQTEQPPEQTPPEQKPAEQPPEQKPPEQKPAEQPPEQKPPEQKPAEQPPEQKPAEQKPAEQPPEQKPAEQKSSAVEKLEQEINSDRAKQEALEELIRDLNQGEQK
jgi:hypothetical protein